MHTRLIFWVKLPFYKMIYNLSSAPAQPTLWEISETEYSIHEYEEFTDLIVGQHPPIIHNDYLQVFNEISKDQLKIKPVKIIRKSTNENWNDYSALIIDKQINPENIGTLDSSGLKIWCHFTYPFISEKLKLKLKELSFNKLSFSEGFSMWA